jgi:hypothetical protein
MALELLTHLLIYFTLLSVLLYSSVAYNPRMWLHRMPPAVTAKVPPKTAAEKTLLFKTVAIPFLLLLTVYPFLYAFQQDAVWLNYFLIFSAFFAGFDVWDTLILDLLIFCVITPKFIIIPGTERQDYADMKPHLISGAKGLLISLITSGILATILFFMKRVLAGP